MRNASHMRNKARYSSRIVRDSFPNPFPCYYITPISKTVRRMLKNELSTRQMTARNVLPFFKINMYYHTQPVWSLSSLAIMLPVPSPGKGRGLVDPVNNTSTEKLILVHKFRHYTPWLTPWKNDCSSQTDKAASEQDWFRDDDPCEEKVNGLKEEECSAVCNLEHKNI